MKIGCCAPIEKAQAVSDAGFDYLECTVVSLDPEGGEAAFEEILQQFLTSPVPVEAFNVFLPGDLAVVGPSVDWQRVKAYLKSALRRVSKIGADVVVFGSGKARSIPEGFARDKAEEQLRKFLHLAADEAEANNVTIVIEPLNKKESNIINSVAEAVDFVKAVNRPPIQALADFYHIDEDNEPLTNIRDCRENVFHIHVADTGRKAPGTGSYPYDEFSAYVKQTRSPRVSIECGWTDFEAEAPAALAFLRKKFA